MKKLLSVITISVILVFATWGCSSSSDTGDDVMTDVMTDIAEDLGMDVAKDVGMDIPKDVTNPMMAMVRAIHLSPDAPNVDVFANDTEPAVIMDLAFPMGTDYLEVDPGMYNFDLSPAGDGLAASVLDTGDLDLEDGMYYTAVAFDEVASLKVLPIMDDYADLAAGEIRVRAIHAAAGVGQVDIWNIPETGDPAALYTDVDFEAVGDYMDLPAGAYKLGFDLDNDMTPDLVFQTPDLAAGSVINLFAVKDGDDVFLIAQLNDGTTARIDPVTPQ